MRRVVIYGSIFAATLLSAPGTAVAIRPATEQEVAQFRTAAREAEDTTTCSELERGPASSYSCKWVPRTDYEPLITEARVSTLDETWATAFLAPAPRTTEAATAVFREEFQQVNNGGIPEARGVWHMFTSGSGCELAERAFGESGGTEIHLIPDLAVAMGCTPLIPTKVRCLDNFRTSLLALDKPLQCAVNPPKGSPFHGWMNIRGLHWHEWGNEDRAWALGVIRGIPPRLRRSRPSSSKTIRGRPTTTLGSPPPVRLVVSGRVSCGTSYFYSRLGVVSQFGHFEVTLPTCPDQFFVPS